MALIDCISTGPGILGVMLSLEMDSTYMENINKSSDFTWITKLRVYILSFDAYAAEHINDFWFKCFPYLLAVQLPIYTSGLCNAVLSYERLLSAYI